VAAADAARKSFVKPFRPFFTVKLPSGRAVILMWLPPSSFVKFAMKLSGDWMSFATKLRIMQLPEVLESR